MAKVYEAHIALLHRLAELAVKGDAADKAILLTEAAQALTNLQGRSQGVGSKQATLPHTPS